MPRQYTGSPSAREEIGLVPGGQLTFVRFSPTLRLVFCAEWHEGATVKDRSMIAIVEACRAGLLGFSHWKNNLIAGSIVGIVALPLAMAFAIASGAKPEQGLYTAIIAAIVVALFGGTRTQIAGPTGAFVVILAAITAQHGIVGLQVATVMAGIILCLMGWLQLGNVIKYISYPVVVGFTSGIAVIIFVGQWKEFFGLPVLIPIDAPFYQKILNLVIAFPALTLETTLLSLGSLLILAFGSRFIKKIPSPLLAMLCATGVQSFFKFPHIATIGSSFGSIPQSLPSFLVPDFAHVNVLQLVGPAITIALLGAIESLLSAAAADSLSGCKYDANQELLGQGFANIVTPFWGGFASTGAIARTITNSRNGGTCALAAITHSIVLLLVLLIFAPYAEHIPLAALAAILFVVAYNMSDLPEFMHIVRGAPWYDVCVLWATFLLTIFTDLVIAVAVGVVLDIVLFVAKTYHMVNVNRQPLSVATAPMTALQLDEKFLADGAFYTIEGPLFFGVAEKIEQAIIETRGSPKFVVLRLAAMPFIDMTGLRMITRVVEHFHKRGISVYLCGANKRVTQKLARIGLLSLVKGGIVYPSLSVIADEYAGATQ